MTSTTTEVAGKTRVRIGVLSRFADNDRWLWRAMLAPAILYIVLLVGFPFLLSLYYSVSSVTVASQDMHFVGLENFRRIVESSTFWLSLQNTIVITVVSQFFVLVLANILATALVVDFRGRWLVRLLILLPWVAPISLGSIGWLWIFDSIYSVINWTARAVGLLGPNEWPIWLGQPTLARASIIIVNVWRILPLATIIILAGLSSIPRDIHDAAEVDGAGFWRHQFQITMPLILPITLVALLFGIIFTFTDMIVVFVLTRGGPYDTTQVIASWAYFTGIQGGDLAGGAAISLFLFPSSPALQSCSCGWPGAPRSRKMAPGFARARHIADKAAHAAVLVFFVTFLAFPFYWMVITAFKTNQDLYNTQNNPYLFNSPPTLRHLSVLFEDTQYLQWLLNTGFVGVVVVIITLLLAVPAGYALARMTGAWAQTLGVTIFLTYLVPPTILFIPFSRIIAMLGLQDLVWSLILVYPSFTVPFCTWLLMGFFKAIPVILRRRP